VIFVAASGVQFLALELGFSALFAEVGLVLYVVAERVEARLTIFVAEGVWVIFSAVTQEYVRMV